MSKVSPTSLLEARVLDSNVDDRLLTKAFNLRLNKLWTLDLGLSVNGRLFR